MKQTVTFTTFADAFRALRPDNFSRNGLECLFEYLEEYEEDTGEEMDFDVIALCCDFAEYTFDEVKSEYSWVDGIEDAEDMAGMVDVLSYHTLAIQVNDNAVIIQAF